MIFSPHFLRTDSLGKLPVSEFSKIALAIGTFDGLHIGHQHVMRTLIQEATRLNAASVVLTFSPHPRAIIHGAAHGPELLVSTDRRADLCRELGMNAIVTEPFTQDLAAMAPDSFMRYLFQNPQIDVACICVGSNWRFGANAVGDISFLQHYSVERNFVFHAVDEVKLNRTTVSSTAIRELIANGDLDLARQMLGRAPSLEGVVVHGNHIATEKLEHPTANLQVLYGVIPPNGVYSAFVKISNTEEHIPAVVNIGFSPTFGGTERRVEVHLLQSFRYDLYGTFLRLDLCQFLRKEMQFPDVESLKKQIEFDVKNAVSSLTAKKDWLFHE